jgi:hypothetical protein
MSTDPVTNPAFHDWTKLIVHYCTGTGHQGTLKNPVDSNGRKIYFRGQNVTLAVFDWIEKRYGALSDPGAAVYLTGDSAGGLAAFLWADYLKGLVRGRYRVLPDSGIFND